MAYALKYYQNIEQMKPYSGATTWRIEIYLEGYGGGSSEVNFTRDSIELSREGDLLEGVQGTKLTLGLEANSSQEFSEFADAAWGDYKVVLTFDPAGAGQIKFVGYNQSEIYTEDYADPDAGYSTRVEFTCGLSHLKHVRFDNSGTLYTGQKTLIETLRLCLNELPSPISIRESVNIYEDNINSTSTDSMFNQIYTDVSVYKETKNENSSSTEVGFMCNKTIEEILKPFNAHIFQWNGRWLIVRPQEYLDTTIYYRDFNANVGTESTVTVDGTGSYTSNKRTITGVDGTSTELILPVSSAELSTEVPLNRIKLTYDMQNLDVDSNNLIKNSSFKEAYISGTYTIPNHWTFAGDDPTTYDAITITQNENWFEFEPVGQAAASAIDLTKYFEQTKTNIPFATTDSLQFSFDFWMRLEGTPTSPPLTTTTLYNFLSNTFFITWEVEIQVGSYYLSGDNVSGFSWSLVAQRATFTRTGVQINNPTLQSFSYILPAAGRYSFVETLPSLPITSIATLRTRIYRPYHNYETYDTAETDWNLSMDTLRQHGFKIVYLPAGLPPVQEEVIFADIDEDANEESITTIHGDGVHSATLNSFRKSDGTITETWARRGVAESLPILKILLSNFKNLRGGFIENLSGMLIGEFEMFNSIRATYDGTVDYYIKDYTYKIETNEIDVNLMELEAFSVTQTLVTSQTVTLLDEQDQDIIGDPQPQQPEYKIAQPQTSIAPNQLNLNGYN